METTFKWLTIITGTITVLSRIVLQFSLWDAETNIVLSYWIGLGVLIFFIGITGWGITWLI